MVNTVYLINMIRWGLIPLFLLGLNASSAQNFDPLIRRVWENNHQLRSQEFELEKAKIMLEEAKAMYRPTLTFGTQYTLASGGRSIDFPIGDLLNPVHNSLNELTGTKQFPTLQNQSILFLPNNFYDARFRIQQPIFYPDLAINREVKSKQQELKTMEIRAFKRLLVKDFMNGFFQWQQSIQVIQIYDEAQILLDEAARSTRSMIRNGVALPSALTRIEGDRATIEAQQIAARTGEENAWSYLLFLIGENNLLREELVVDFPGLPGLPEGSFTDKEEIEQLNIGLELDQLVVEKESNFIKPRLTAQLDFGSQDFDFGFQPYGLLGLNFEWNLFDGKRNQMRKQQALTSVQVRSEQKLQVQEQLELQVKMARRNLESGIAQAHTFQPRIEAADKNYRDVLKKYEAGSANYLELLDARTQTTQAQIAYLVSRYEAWARWVDFQYSNASYPID